MTLAYADRFRRVLKTINSEPAPAYSTENAVYPNGVFVTCYQWTESEFTALFSALQAGADLIYPDTADSILWSLLKGVEQPMNFCELVANCISDGSLDDALSAWLEENNPSPSVGGGTILPTSISSQNLLPPNWICDDAHAYGMALSIVEYLDAEFLSALALIEVATNGAEALSLLMDNTDATAILGTAFELSAWLQDTVVENYASKATNQVKIDLACDLYCIIKECSLSLDDLLTWASRNSPVDTAIFTLADLALNAIALDANLSGKAFTAGCFWFVMQLQRLQADASLPLGLLSMADVIALSSDETSQDYTLCADCPEPIVTFQHVFDFTQTSDLWRNALNDPSRATWVLGSGFTRGAYQNRLQIETVGTYSFTLTDIEVELSEGFTVQSGGSAGCTGINGYTAGQSVPMSFGAIDISLELNNSRLNVTLNNYQTPSNVQPFSPSLAIRRVIVSGLGVDPFI